MRKAAVLSVLSEKKQQLRTTIQNSIIINYATLINKIANAQSPQRPVR